MTNTGTSRACYGCVEFANNERTMAYYRWACSEGMFPPAGQPKFFDLCWCEDDAPEDPYVDPETDSVCWYDASVPESKEFLGVIILNRPVKNSTFEREVSDGFLEGSILGMPKKKGRSFVFDVILLATSCEGMAYGKEWLRSVLEDGPCSGTVGASCQSCFGKRLGLRVHCPEGDTTDGGFHEWYSVGLVDGIADSEEENTRKESCCIIQPMTFTMHSESPYSFAPDAIEICDATVDDAYVRCYDWLNDGDCDEEDEPNRCSVDPLCDSDASLDFDPELSNPQCEICTPVARAITACCTNDLPAVYDTTFKIDIYAGINPADDDLIRRGMRNFRLKVYQNPKGLPCIIDDETYDAWINEEPCIEFATSYVPYDSVLTIDGRLERVTLTCGNVCKPYSFVITSADGPLFPLLSRCTPMMIVAEFDYYTSQLVPEAVGIKPSRITVDSYLRFRN